jgi:hypothetical protein
MKRNGRCVCGLKLTHHFDKRNAKLSCHEARQQHPRARTTRADIFAQSLRMGVR